MKSISRRSLNLGAGVLALAVVMGIGLTTWRSAPDSSATGQESVAISKLTDRIAALEQQNNELAALLARRQTVVSHGARAADARREEHKERQQRMLQDPAYAEAEQRKRLAQLDQQFGSEPVSVEWASKASVKVEDALVSAAMRAGKQSLPGQVDCRSTQCKIQVRIPEDAYDELITYLSVEMADLLPKSRIVSIRRDDGTQDVSIFASSERTTPNRS